MSEPTMAGAAFTDRLSIGLLALTVVSGIVDSLSFLGLGHVFTANMTGNIVFLGFAAVGTPGISVARTITSLAAFLSGAVIGGYFGREIANPLRRHRLGICATCEAALLFTAAIAVIVVDGGPTVLQGRQYAVIVLTALAMGLRNATVRQLAVPDLTTTTVVTMTLTGLAADFALAGATHLRSWRRSDRSRQCSSGRRLEPCSSPGTASWPHRCSLASSKRFPTAGSCCRSSPSAADSGMGP